MGENFIGRGERTCIKILQEVFRLALQKPGMWENRNGIYTQVPLPSLINPEMPLDEIHAKSSVDIVVRAGGDLVAYYVNGNEHTGELKSKRDAVRYGFLRDAGFKVVVLRESECPHLFRERHNWGAYAEVLSAMQVAGLECHGITRLYSPDDGGMPL